jgi:hypothetical protein
LVTRVAKPKEPFNPFYALVIVLGVAFCVTTFAFYTMAFRASAPAAAEVDQSPGLMSLVDRYGVQTMGVELGLLAVATFGAMWLDQLRTRNTKSKQPSDSIDGKETP